MLSSKYFIYSPLALNNCSKITSVCHVSPRIRDNNTMHSQLQAKILLLCQMILFFIAVFSIIFYSLKLQLLIWQHLLSRPTRYNCIKIQSQSLSHLRDRRYKDITRGFHCDARVSKQRNCHLTMRTFVKFFSPKIKENIFFEFLNFRIIKFL